MPTADTTPLLLADWRCVRISGADRSSFLQGQLTQDMTALAPDRPLLAGWANPKGRLLCTAWLVDWQDSVNLLLPADLADTLARRLKMFVLRAAVNISTPDASVWFQAQANPDDKGLTDCFYDANSYSFSPASDENWRLGLGKPEGLTQSADAAKAMRSACIAAGIPVLRAATTETFVPQMTNLDLLGGISFNKGCYVGQEIVARTHNLGRIKRRMFRFTASNGVIEPGNPVKSGDDVAGYVVDAVTDGSSTDVLAVIRLEKLAAQLNVNSIELTQAALPYAIPECRP